MEDNMTELQMMSRSRIHNFPDDSYDKVTDIGHT